MEFKRPYEEKPRVQFATVGESRTHQEFKAECDINNVMKKFERTGIIEHRNNFEGDYRNFLDIPSDYHEAMGAVLEAQDMFMSLPSKIRKRFHNDPAAFVEFATDPGNGKELVALGLATKRPDGEVDDPGGTPTKKPLSQQAAPSGPPKAKPAASEQKPSEENSD